MYCSFPIAAVCCYYMSDGTTNRKREIINSTIHHEFVSTMVYSLLSLNSNKVYFLFKTTVIDTLISILQRNKRNVNEEGTTTSTDKKIKQTDAVTEELFSMCSTLN